MREEQTEVTAARLVVVGVGADGMAGLAPSSRAALASATTVYGAPRHLGMLDDTVTAVLREFPSPMVPAMRDELAAARGQVHVLASGDPLLHGVGATLIRWFGAQRVHVLPHVSSVTLACARLGWPVHDTEVISVVSAAVHTAVRRGGRAVVLSRDGATPAQLARLLTDAGRGASRMTVLSDLGGPAERRRDGDAQDWPPGDAEDLNVVAVHYLPDDRLLAAVPDDHFDHDGQLTKQSMRAVTLAALAPRPGELLWDVGAGSGSVAVQWCLAGPGCRAVAFERDERRRRRITGNVRRFGVAVDVRGAAPAALADAPEPAAVFVGGGFTGEGVLAACWERLPAGGRLVANVVTAESEAALVAAFAAHGGELRRFQHYRGEPVGSFTGWRPAMPVTQWSAVKG